LLEYMAMQLAVASQDEDMHSTGLLEALLPLLKADALDPALPSPDRVSNLNLFNDSFSEIFSLIDAPDNQLRDLWAKLSPLEREMGNTIQDKCYMLTTDGRFGLGPMSAEPGDAIWILGGCNSPMVLRQDPPGDGTRYTLIGQVYIHGSMHGEAVREPRPNLRRIMLV